MYDLKSNLNAVQLPEDATLTHWDEGEQAGSVLTLGRGPIDGERYTVRVTECCYGRTDEDGVRTEYGVTTTDEDGTTLYEEDDDVSRHLTWEERRVVWSLEEYYQADLDSVYADMGLTTDDDDDTEAA